MNSRRIDFATLEWQSPLLGARFKRFEQDGRVVRLVEFTDQLVEPDWCRKGHVGYVVEGRVTIDFSGTPVTYQAGDALYIRADETDKHMASVAKGENVVLFMVEDAADD